METVSPNSVASYAVSVYGPGGMTIPAALSAATLTVQGRTLPATVLGQTLAATLPGDLTPGPATLLWAWTQAAGGVTSAQTFGKAVSVAAPVGPTRPPVFAPAGALVVARRRLQALADGLGDTDLSAEITLAARLLSARLPALPAYADLDAAHQAFYDLATGLHAAASLLAPAISSANDGLARLKTSDGTSDYEYTFAVPSLAERERWAAEIAEAVAYLERLARPPKRGRQPFSMFGAAGVTRARERRPACVPEPSLWGLLPEGWY